MEFNHLFFIGLLILLSILYLSFKEQIFVEETYSGAPIGMSPGYVINSTKGEKPANAPIEVMRTSYSEPKTVVSSGPNSPSQEAPLGEIVVTAPATANDPYAQSHESATAEPSMRYPERSFRPAPPNDFTGIAVESGVAGTRSDVAMANYQRFGPELIQNGGVILNGIFANDTGENNSFSAF
jgi:hypothetical protein